MRCCSLQFDAVHRLRTAWSVVFPQVGANRDAFTVMVSLMNCWWFLFSYCVLTLYLKCSFCFCTCQSSIACVRNRFCLRHNHWNSFSVLKNFTAFVKMFGWFGVHGTVCLMPGDSMLCVCQAFDFVFHVSHPFPNKCVCDSLHRGVLSSMIWQKSSPFKYHSKKNAKTTNTTKTVNVQCLFFGFFLFHSRVCRMLFH